MGPDGPIEPSQERPEDLVLWDETLRDGEQTPGVHLTVEEKVEIAKELDAVGVDILCAGIPVVSGGELEAVQAVADEGLDASVAAAARTLERDVDAVLDAEADEISLFIACSDVHLKHKLERSRDEVLGLAMDAVEYAVDHGLDVTFVTEDTVRADPAFAARLYQACIEVGANRLLFCDTVGVLTPPATRSFYEAMRSAGTAEDPPEWGFHNHNDLGMATANALAAFEAGVPCLSVTVNGLGERAGNAALEEVVMALEELYGVDTGIETEKLYELSRTVEEATGVPVSPLKPIVGSNAFTRRADREGSTMFGEPVVDGHLDPGSLGRSRTEVYGAGLDETVLADILSKQGIAVKADVLAEILKQVRARSLDPQERSSVLVHAVRGWIDRLAGVDDETFWAIVEEVTGLRPGSSP